VRVLDAASAEEHRAAKRRAKQRHGHVDHDEDETSLNEHIDDDDGSVQSSVVDPLFRPNAMYTSPDEFEKGWVAKYTIPLRSISIKGTHKKGVLIQVATGDKKQVRELIFDTMEDSENFQSVLKKEAENETKRAQLKLEAALGKSTLVNTDEIVTFLYVWFSAEVFQLVGSVFCLHMFLSSLFTSEVVRSSLDGEYLPGTSLPVIPMLCAHLIIRKSIAPNTFRRRKLIPFKLIFVAVPCFSSSPTFD
jgi:hypothetical protein